MGKTATNLVIVLGLITVAFGGYYLYTNHKSSLPGVSVDESRLDEMLQKTNKFVQYRQTLQRIDLNTELFTDPRFTSLLDFGTVPEERPIGRENPFDEAVIADESNAP